MNLGLPRQGYAVNYLKAVKKLNSLHNVHYRKLGNYIKKSTEPGMPGSVFGGGIGNL